MVRADVGGRAEPSGLNRVDSAPSRVESTSPVAAEEGEQLIDVGDGPPKNRARTHTTTREVCSLPGAWVQCMCIGSALQYVPQPRQDDRAHMRMHDRKTPHCDTIMLNTMLFHLAGQALHSVLGSWVSRRFFGGCAVLFPMVVTVYITWWFLTFFDNFFSVRCLCCYVCSRSCRVCACQNAHSPCVNRILCAHAAGV